MTPPRPEAPSRTEVRLDHAIRHETLGSFVPDRVVETDLWNALERGFDEQKGLELLNAIK